MRKQLLALAFFSLSLSLSAMDLLPRLGYTKGVTVNHFGVLSRDLTFYWGNDRFRVNSGIMWVKELLPNQSLQIYEGNKALPAGIRLEVQTLIKEHRKGLMQHLLGLGFNGLNVRGGMENMSQYAYVNHHYTSRERSRQVYLNYIFHLKVYPWITFFNSWGLGASYKKYDYRAWHSDGSNAVYSVERGKWAPGFNFQIGCLLKLKKSKGGHDAL